MKIFKCIVWELTNKFSKRFDPNTINDFKTYEKTKNKIYTDKKSKEKREDVEPSTPVAEEDLTVFYQNLEQLSNCFQNLFRSTEGLNFE